MNQKYVKYFEVTYKNAIAGYTCTGSAYEKKLSELAEEYPDLQLVFREWSDGTEEDGLIEKEDWFRG